MYYIVNKTEIYSLDTGGVFLVTRFRFVRDKDCETVIYIENVVNGFPVGVCH